ncbi:MAG: hypothetical protein Q4A66_10095 [Eubacteriales bacterium]|nr:hypothetical protein [Eubacteriales bacterium]
MTDAQKETLRFYTTNDYLLINGLLWGEDENTIDEFIRIINEDGRGVMAEALEQGFDVRWNCSKEEGERLYKIYQRRFPLIENQSIKNQIIERARADISNMLLCMEPLASEMILYRNIKNRFAEKIEQETSFIHPGFSSCSVDPHIAKNAAYGSGDCTLAQIIAPAGTPAIRLDLMPDVQNEPDEIILAPTEFFVTKVDRANRTICMTCTPSPERQIN